MEKIYIGKIVSTHGIKGEIKILSKFPYKQKVFASDNNILIDNKEYTIESYRVHKKYDMITLKGYHDINEVIPFLKKEIYFDKDNLKLSENEILDEELITYKVISSDGREGTITEIFMASPTNKILRVQLDHEILIPFSSPMIKKIQKNNKCIIIDLIDGM